MDIPYFLKGRLLAYAALVGLLASFSVFAAQPSGEYVLGGHGTLIVTFDGAGNFSGVAAIQEFGVVNIAGSAPVDASGNIDGNFTVSDQRTSVVLLAQTLTGKATAGNAQIQLLLQTNPQTLFKGGLRNGSEGVPSGMYVASVLPTTLLIQCDRSNNRQVVTIQGDQDWGLDLTQGFGGQLLFTQGRKGYGVVYENGDPTNPPRWATAEYDPGRDKLTVTLLNKLFDAHRKPITFSGISSGKYDGIYTLNIFAGDCAAVSVKLTVKEGVVTSSDAAIGAITGTLDDLGNLNFTATKLVEPAGCSAGGTHTGTINFTGLPTDNPVYPQILNGTFSGAGVSGTFTVTQPTGITGATTPGGVPRAENWSGTMTGVHNSTLSQGGVFGEACTISFTFPSSLIKALRGQSQIISGSGSFSCTETIKLQSPFSGTISSLVAGTDSGSVNVTFAGVENGAGATIECDSSSVLINNNVQFFTGPNSGKTLNENRKVLKLRVEYENATLVRGAWQDGKFQLKKQ